MTEGPPFEPYAKALGRISRELANWQHSFLVLVFAILVLLLGRLCLLPLHATRAPSTKRRRKRKINVLLRVEANDERRHVDDLLADADVALADQNASMVDALGQSELEHARLQAAFEEVLDLEREHVIELHARFVQHTHPHQTADQRIALEEALRVLLV